MGSVSASTKLPLQHCPLPLISLVSSRGLWGRLACVDHMGQCATSSQLVASLPVLAFCPIPWACQTQCWPLGAVTLLPASSASSEPESAFPVLCSRLSISISKGPAAHHSVLTDSLPFTPNLPIYPSFLVMNSGGSQGLGLLILKAERRGTRPGVKQLVAWHTERCHCCLLRREIPNHGVAPFSPTTK